MVQPASPGANLAQQPPVVLHARHGLGMALPATLTSFVGREREVRELSVLVGRPETRLVTLVGPGGVGKTRLAIEVARDASDGFDGNVAFVDLAPVATPELVAPSVARALGMREQTDRPLAERVADLLGDRHLLLVFDNFEPFVSDSSLVVQMLARCPHMTALVTSREPLRLSAERVVPVVPVVPLSLPGSDQSTDEPTESEAVRLFVERASAIRADFVLTGANTQAVVEIVRRVDGLPLAIELAAARLAHLPPVALLKRLDRRLPILTGGARDLPERQRTLQSAIAWSYDLLLAAEQRLFRCLSVFVGGLTLEAAEAVCGDVDIDVLAGVASLVDKSLVRPVTGADGGARFLMLETIREFAAEQLAASGEEDAIRDRHATWFLDIARSDAPVFGPFTPDGDLGRLSADHANLRAALTWLDVSGRESDLTELVNRLRWFWYIGAHFAEGESWYERVLRQPQDRPAMVQCDLLTGAGFIAHYHSIGSSSARGHLEEALTIARDAGDVHREAVATDYLAMIAEDTGCYAEADAGFRRAHALYGRASDPWNQVVCEYHLGIVAYGSGDLPAARRQIEGAAVAAERMNDRFLPVWCRDYLVLIACDEGDAARAMALLARQRRELGSGSSQRPEVLVALAGVIATVRADYPRAARLFGARGSLAQEAAIPLPERDVLERYVTLTRERLSTDACDAAWTEGRRLRPAEIDAEIDRLLSGTRESQRQVQQPDRIAIDLTPRELEVLRLIAAGRTDRQIADALHISRRTAEWHVRNALGKLGAANRAEAAVLAGRDHLL